MNRYPGKTRRGLVSRTDPGRVRGLFAKRGAYVTTPTVDRYFPSEPSPCGVMCSTCHMPRKLRRAKNSTVKAQNTRSNEIDGKREAALLPFGANGNPALNRSSGQAVSVLAPARLEPRNTFATIPSGSALRVH